MSAPARVPWSKDHVRYPLEETTCADCGTQGLHKLSFDRLRFICLDARACLALTHRERGKSE